MKPRWMLAAGILAAGLAVGVTTPALAHDPAGTANDPKIVKHAPGDGGSIAYWKKRNAPGSPQPKALRLHALEFAKVYGEMKNVSILGRKVKNVDRISYKFREVSSIVPYPVKLVIQLSNGNWVQLRANECLHPIGGTKWNTTRNWVTGECRVFNTYASFEFEDTVYSGYSTWGKFVEAEGEARIRSVRIVGHDGQLSWVDDIRLDGVLFAGPNVHTHNH